MNWVEKNIIKRILLLLVLPFVSSVSNAQLDGKQGQVFLKNKWILKGQIARTTSDSIIVQLNTDQRFVFPLNEVDSIVYLKEMSYRFGHYTEIGALAATRNRPDNVTTAAFSFQIVNGYHFRKRYFVGLGIAADLYATQTIIPVFTSFRSDLAGTSKLIPYYFVDMGYGTDITNSTIGIRYTGGLMFASGLGFKIPLGAQAGFHINIGYRLQKGKIIISDHTGGYTNHRIALRAGFYL